MTIDMYISGLSLCFFEEAQGWRAWDRRPEPGGFDQGRGSLDQAGWARVLGPEGLGQGDWTMGPGPESLG